MTKMTKLEKAERITELSEKIKNIDENITTIDKAKSIKKPFRINVRLWNSNFDAYGVRPSDFSENTEMRLQKYYRRLINDERKELTAERDRLLRSLK